MRMAIVVAMMVAVVCRAELVATLRVDVEGTATNASSISGVALSQVGEIAGATGDVVRADAVVMTNALDATITARNYLTAESDTLETVAARGGFGGTEEIGPLRVLSKMYGTEAGIDVSGDNWLAIGYSAGRGSSGDNWLAIGFNSGLVTSGDEWAAVGYNSGQGAMGSQWSAIGYSAGYQAQGDYWNAIGFGSGSLAVGDYWGAYGLGAGYAAIHTNSQSLGKYAGRSARGNDRLYIDTYATDPEYAAGGATNDRIFGDSDGTLYLGRGAGAPGGAVGGTLRGAWTGGGFAQQSALATNVQAHAAVAAGTNTLGHVQSVAFAFADNILSITAPMSCTGMVFRFPLLNGAVTNIYLWQVQP